MDPTLGLCGRVLAFQECSMMVENWPSEMGNLFEISFLSWRIQIQIMNSCSLIRVEQIRSL